MGIIVPSSEGPEQPFTFAHERVRQTLLAGISARRRQKVHAGVADASERLYPGAIKERAGEIADHLLKAASFADDRGLVHYLMLAGKTALEAAAFEEAQRNFQSALSHQRTVDLRGRAELLAYLAMAERGLERWDAALASLDEALEIYLRLGDREMIGKSFAESTHALTRGGRIQQGIERAGRGLAYLEGDVSVERVRLLSSLRHAHAAAAAHALPPPALHHSSHHPSLLS